MSTRDTNKNYVQTHKSNAEAFYSFEKKKKKFTTITQKFTGFTILLIKIVEGRNILMEGYAISGEEKEKMG